MTVLPYGSWPSVISAETIAGAAPRLEGARFVGDEIWWGQSLPEEGGRTTVRRRSATGEISDLLPAPANARSLVHEYGGGAWTESDGILFFVSKDDHRLWRRKDGSDPVPLTPVAPGDRFGGLVAAGPWLLAVRERHEGTRVTHDIVAVAQDGSDAGAEPRDGLCVVASGTDFVAQPAMSPDGSRLAWIGWNHPDMPWDAATLFVAPFGQPEQAEAVGGSLNGERRAAVQPVWTGAEELTFADDPSGRWNLWRARPGSEPQPIAPADADTGGPLWVLGARWFAPLDDGRLVAVRTNGRDELWVIDPASGSERRLETPLSSGLTIEDACGHRVLVTGGGAGVGNGLWLIDVETGRSEAIVGGRTPWPADWTPLGRPLTVEGPHGPVHAFDFPPTNPEVSGPGDEKPPYVVFVHGGPTSHVGGAASGSVAFYTSRGIGVLDVNYGGSTGYGRAYRERLAGTWGIVDVDDTVAAIRGLVAEGRADERRLAIEGGSAGGWTVLASLARSEVFGAGICRYGVGDARALAGDTHDFESRYLDGLIGPLPEAEAVYRERSPLTHAAQIHAPMLLLHGEEDAVVPPAHSEAIRDALAAQGIPHRYVLYAGEGHGFRRRETIIDAAEKSYAFLGQVFGFETPGVPVIELE